MQLVDALSRCPARASHEIKLNMCVDYVSISRLWIKTIKESLQEYPILARVYQLTQQGWPHQRRHVSHIARRYFNFRDELSTDNGLLLKVPCLVILNVLKEEYLHHLHEGNLSAKKIQENALRNTSTGLVLMLRFQIMAGGTKSVSRDPDSQRNPSAT